MFEITAPFSAQLGLMSGTLAIFCFVPYVRDVALRRTRPLRSSWLIWAVVTVIAFTTQVAQGAGASLWFSGVIALGSCVIFALSIPFGMGDYLARTDLCAMLVCCAALVVWGMTSDPSLPLYCAIGISAVAGLLTLRKAFHAPQTETLSKWTMGAIASALGVLSVGQFDPVLSAQPLYLTGLHMSVAGAILLGRQRMRAPAHTVSNVYRPMNSARRSSRASQR